MDRQALDRHITGNWGEDQIDHAWEKFHEQIDDDANTFSLTDMDAFVAWKLGLAALKAVREIKGTFPHDAPEPDICPPDDQDSGHE